DASDCYPIGETTVTYTVPGNTGSCSFTVTVNDTEAPTLNCPANTTISLDPGLCDAVFTFNITGTDNCPFAGPGATVFTTDAGGNQNSVGGQIFFDVNNSTATSLNITEFGVRITNAT